MSNKRFELAISSDKKEFKNEILEVSVIKKGNFLLSCGAKSDFYADFRILFGFPKLMNLGVSLLSNILGHNQLNFDLICGIPTAGLVWASLLSDNLTKPLIYCKSIKKSYGTERQIEGLYKEGQKIVIIDDVITSGKTALNIIDILRQQGLKILAVLTILDRQDFRKSRLKRHGIPLYSIFKRSDFA